MHKIDLRMRWLYFLMISVILTAPGLSNAQKDDRVKHIEAVKAAFITQKLDLTTREAQNFWPLYNTYQKEIEALYIQKKHDPASRRDDPNKQLDDEFMHDERMLEMKKKYRKRFA